jgi:glycerate kinase
LALLKPADRDPMRTTSFGTGELMVAAAEMGCRKIILGIGGSATVEGGIGCAQACGLPVIRKDAEPISPNDPLVGDDLVDIALMKRGRGSRVDGVEIVVACDVTNPLVGANGAAAVYGPQKGATPEHIKILDDALAGIVNRSGTADEASTPGAGAAGGMGYAMLAFFGARLSPGIDLVIDACRLKDRLKGATLCLTGEGKMDATSLQGKTISGVGAACNEQHILCAGIFGTIADEAWSSTSPLVTAGRYAASSGPATLEQSMASAGTHVARVAEQIVRTFLAGRDMI